MHSSIYWPITALTMCETVPIIAVLRCILCGISKAMNPQRYQKACPRFELLIFAIPMPSAGLISLGVFGLQSSSLPTPWSGTLQPQNSRSRPARSLRDTHYSDSSVTFDDARNVPSTSTEDKSSRQLREAPYHDVWILPAVA